MKKQKYKLLSTLLVGAGCLLAGGLLQNNTFAIGNAAFTDENFYACVVRQFNALYPNEVTIATNPADTVLTNAQLAKMEFLNCERINPSQVWSLYGNLPSYYELNGPKATSVAGLEKLTGLKSLYLQGHDLTSIDLSKNVNLTELGLGQNGLTEVDLSKNVKINHLGIHEPITSFYEPTLTELGSANLQGCELESIDVSKNQKLVNLLLNDGNRKIKELDLTKNQKLRTLTIDPENQAFVTPYVEVKTTDECKVTAKIPIISSYMTVSNNSYYTYNSSNSTLTFKKKPVKNLINSGYFRTIQTGTEGSVDRVYYIFLPDSVYTEYDKLESCVAKADEEEVPVPDTSAGSKSGVKTPDTGAMTGENNAKIIGISLLAISGIALVVYLAAYAHRRQKNHIKF
ncbi:hypothetical protein IKD98_02250 [Candidatus Saccharibacteria bacterium]|nr:hypothetical protein [Candidatus Saccharibacteria bacterium]